MNYAAIRDERKLDPTALGYNQDDVHDLAILNAADPHAALVAKTSISKNDFLRLTMIAAGRLKNLHQSDGTTALDATIANIWYESIVQARSADPGTMIDLTLVSLLGDPVALNVLTQSESNALLKRAPTRAEVLGFVAAGELLTLDDVQRSH